MPIINRLAALQEELTAWRRTLHQHPQTNYEETWISDFVAEKLQSFGLEIHRNIAVTGVVGILHGQKPGPMIGLRADMDALDIVEQNNMPWQSKTPGKMHGCGHDGHTTMLLGAARYLAETRNFSGSVAFIFQPAEEGGNGAQRMIDEGLFEKFPITQVYAMHNWPDLPIGQIAVAPGPMLANSDRFTLTITGIGGHAAYPQNITDPVVVAAHIITAWQSIVSRNIHPMEAGVISVTMLKASDAFNVVADKVVLNGTARSYKPEVRDLIEKRMGELATAIASGFGASAVLDYNRGYDATINTAPETAVAAKVAAEIVGADNVDTAFVPIMGGEDFGAMLKAKPGCYIVVGAADEEHKNKLHHPCYDFNDKIIPIGASYFARLVETVLSKDTSPNKDRAAA